MLKLLNAGRAEEQQLKADQVRVVQPEAFPEVTLVGFLTGSNSCLIGRAIVDGKSVLPGEACGIVMRKHGWEAAKGEQRGQLALSWVRDALTAFGEQLVTTRPKAWRSHNPDFAAPESLCTLTGEVRLNVWLEQAPGQTESRQFRRQLYWFGPDGSLVRSRVLDTFEL